MLRDIKSCGLLLLVFLIALSAFTGCKERQEKAVNKPDIPPDSVLHKTLRTRLEQADHLMADSINLKVQKGVVSVTGTVDNLLTKKRISDYAENVSGVLSVVNNVYVESNRPDSLISRDVNRALSTDPATEEWEISATVNNGVVTLMGSVDSWQEKHLAETIATSIKGVTEITNDIVVGYNETREPKHIRAEVRKMLKWDSRIDDKLIEVKVDGFTVELSGEVGSLKHKKLAKEIAHVTGVKKVKTEKLDIRPSIQNKMVRREMAANISDKQIKDAINRAFKYDPRVDSSDIKVNINGDVALLEGTVENIITKLNAGQDALNTVGVNKVQNSIKVQRKVVVRPEVPTTDKGIKQRIEAMINRDPYVELVEVDVRVDKGRVKLTGTVHSTYEKTHIEELAQQVKGVISIENNIKLQKAT